MDDHSANFAPVEDENLASETGAEPAAHVSTAPAPGDLAVRLVEAALFASSEPVSARSLLALLAPFDRSDIEALVAVVAARHEGSGITVQAVAGGWQFRTATDLAPYLTQVQKRPRRLPRAAMETLAIVAYHQPCTRTEIEEIRGVSLGQNVLEALIEAGLIVPVGRKEVPGRPTLWGTSRTFLERFGLRDLRDLPRREELVVELPEASAAAAAAPQLALVDTPEDDSPSGDLATAESAA